ncbi:MAG: hypothetical protein KIS92_06175 [Planctomycetota bacterium]|nr:hypothetical protein [Planctomycetota bacterium]
MRWSLDLTTDILIAQTPPGGPVTPQALEGLRPSVTLGPNEIGHTGQVWVFADGDALEVAAIGSARPGRLKPAYPEFYLRDHLVVMLNPGHDHGSRRMYSVDDAGTVRGEAAQMYPGEEPKDAPKRTLPEPPQADGEFRALGPDRYFARLRIPAKDVWNEGVTGFGVKVGLHDEIVPDALCAPEFPAWASDQPFAFIDLYAAEPRLTVTRVEIPEPVWGGDASTVILSGSAKNLPAGVVRAEVVLPPDGESVRTEAAWEAREGRFRVAVPVVFPHQGKWANPLDKAGKLRMSVAAGGTDLWRAEYAFGFDMSIIVRERYGANGKPLPPRPAPSDPDFVNRFRAYVLARMPNYRQRTTAEGAPSDFYLEDPEGGAHLDLAKPGSLDRAVEMLVARFPDWQDALCGIAAWVYHPLITRHSSSWTGVAGQAHLETLVRLGGCFCSDTSVLSAHLAERAGARMNVPIKGYAMGLRGHLCTLLETPLGRVVIDGMHGLYYHTLDNARLATLDEMRTQREVTRRMWHFCGTNKEDFYFQNYTQTIRPLRPRPFVWPVAEG